ncbi:PPA1309 family protein [Marinactinospora thermotolerans]|uniref:PPA1309 family protein n=1 Tax=Marinactinospora thermotolerans TaxID=531310 RepID=UPI001F27D097|nr:PPA1309 family protein [Marinactinospora thermotolerans]
MSFNIREVVLDLERHAADQGWDQPVRVYALVPTADLIAQEPHLAGLLGVSEPVDAADLTPIEQEPLPEGVPIEEALGRMAWPEAVAGCALVMERLVVKGSDETLDPPRGADAAAWAAEQPGSEEIRMVAGVLRDGSRHSALRMRSHDSPDQVLNGQDLVPALTSALALTLEE